MLVQRAAEAKVVSAFAMYTWDCAWEVFLFDFAVNCVYAVWCGAPLEVLEIVNICAGEQFMVSSCSLVSGNLAIPPANSPIFEILLY